MLDFKTKFSEHEISTVLSHNTRFRTGINSKYDNLSSNYKRFCVRSNF